MTRQPSISATRVKQATPLVPEQTIETVTEDVEWAKTQMRSEKT